MTTLAIGILVVGLNLLVFWGAHYWASQARPKQIGWIFGAAEILRLFIFFGGAHILWIWRRRPYEVVAYIFLAALVQMTVQILLTSRNKSRGVAPSPGC